MFTKFGEYRTFHENGQLWTQGFYRNEKREGERKVWYENGQVCEQAFYRNGKLEGERRVWYKNGQPWVHAFYQNGNLIDPSFSRVKNKSLLRVKNLFRNNYDLSSTMISDLTTIIMPK